MDKTAQEAREMSGGKGRSTVGGRGILHPAKVDGVIEVIGTVSPQSYPRGVGRAAQGRGGGLRRAIPLHPLQIAHHLRPLHHGLPHHHSLADKARPQEGD
jgi:hypothetical protein